MEDCWQDCPAIPECNREVRAIRLPSLDAERTTPSPVGSQGTSGEQTCQKGDSQIRVSRAAHLQPRAGTDSSTFNGLSTDDRLLQAG